MTHKTPPSTHHNPTRNQIPNRTTAARKPSTCKSRCWDWMITPSGNCHYAKNRASFASYRRAPGRVGSQRVLGVGSVELKVRRAPDDARPNVLALQGVLHLPDASCNGLSLPRYRGANGLVGITGEERGRGGFLQARSEVDGERLWYGDEYCGWSRVVLWGDPRGETYLGQEPEGSMLGVVASAEELDQLFTRVKERSLV
ncbi:hypothetical protein P175DRAFT_0438057 [Aspergillus ochraceoroseus IBT 24754]|uniref:Uncharacterized protein n=1 Tax=Aspergillus ochraceoroseus IBT 24754 TaxID=1392256 RepID=A0A2T5LWD7_9EURO|nr:uncharacterized protein P175DRAFT_0438057 [Aspergillus ochraceoroseus IBT 24754]PTU20600.1 hypothetical protein P175DRAFT_0438057 [Aspergillus ochraceoroseus IBT 24754]